MLADLLTDTWLKLVVAVLTALGALLTFWNTWRKERQRDTAEIQASRDTIPAVMRNLAAASVPMPALQVDQLNELFRAAEKLAAEMTRLGIACERHTDETRRGSAAAESLSDEMRRLCAAITRSSREAEDRWNERNPSRETLNGSSRPPKR
jgi:hypothetical protein